MLTLESGAYPQYALAFLYLAPLQNDSLVISQCVLFTFGDVLLYVKDGGVW